MALKEAIQSVQPKTDIKFSIFDREVKPMDLLRDSIRNPKNQGWSFNTGDPEFWKFSSELIIPKGKALDLGSGFGRTSVPFALHGMEVTAYESNPAIAGAMRIVVENFDDLPISVRDEDIRTADFGKNVYDTLILGQTFAHFESREEAFKVIDKAIRALKPGGHIWFRGNGPGYDGLEEQMASKHRSYDPFLDAEVKSSKEHYINTCNCSGEKGVEGHLYFDQMEVIQHMSERGIKVTHAQMVSERGKTNIMYGEDWEPDRDYFDENVSIEDLFNGGVEGQRTFRGDDMITIIGQKINP